MVQSQIAEYDNLMQNLTELSGMKISTAEDVNSLYITLLAEVYIKVDI